MSDQIVTKLAQVSLRSEEISQNSNANSVARNNADDDASKNNPWKPIAAGENNVLESDTWPEPSAPGEQRRPATFRQPEEKLKRKIKWKTFDSEQLGPSYYRGRGRGHFYGHYFVPQTMSPLRRGGFRGRIAIDNNKNPRMNGFFTKYTGRPVRMPIEHKDDRYTEPPSDPVQEVSANASTPSEVKGVGNTKPRDELTECDDGKPPASSEAPTSSSGSLSVNHNCAQAVGSEFDPKVACPTQATSKRTFRERSFASVVASDSTIASSYEAGPLGRARRSYLRQNPLFTLDADTYNDQGSVLASSAVSPFIPFHSVAPIAYIIPGAPGVGSTLWGTGLQLSHATAPHLVPVPTTDSIGLPQPSIVSFTQRVVEDTPSGVRTDEDEPYLRSSSVVSATNSVVSKAVPGRGINVELVDVEEMLNYVEDVGSSNVVFPNHLKNHPTIVAVRNTLKKSSVDGSTDPPLPLSTEPSPPDNQPTEKYIKSEDVVIVNDHVFFVPRNASKTKFLKFTCKLDYIRHHLEYYFSETNLQRDSHLISILLANQLVCPVSDLLQFNRLRWVSTTDTELLEAASRSQNLTIIMSSDGYPLGLRPSSEHLANLAQHYLPSSADSMFQHFVDKRSPVNGFSKVEVSACPSTASVMGPTSEPAQLTTSAHSSELSGNAGGSLTSSRIPNQLVQPAVFISPGPRMELSGYTTGPSTGHQTPHYTPSETSAGSVGHSTAFTQPTYYSPQAALLASSAVIHPSIPTSPSTGLHSSDIAPAFMPFYRVAAPGHIGSTMGAYLPQLAGSSTFPPTSSGFLLQFVPSAQSALTGGYQHLSNPLLSRSAVGSFNSAGIWVPLATGANSSSQSGANPLNQGFQAVLNVPSHIANIPIANAGGYAAMLPSLSTNIPFGPFHFSAQNVESLYSGHLEPKISDDPAQHVLRHPAKVSVNAFLTPNSIVPPILPNTASSTDLNAGSNYFSVYNNRSSTAPPAFTDSCPQSSRTTPKKVS